MKRNGVLVFWLALAIIVCLPGVSNAWLYDGREGRYAIPIHGVDSPYRGSNPAHWAAQKFWLPKEVEITQLGAQVGKSWDPNNKGFLVSLVSDVNDISGSTLGSWNVIPQAGAALYSYWNTDPIRLQPNHDYALIFAPGDNLFSGSVAISFYGLYPIQFTTNQGGSWYTLSGVYYYPAAVRLDGYVVPEPSPLTALVPGLGGLLLHVRVKRLNAHRKKVGRNQTRA